MTTEQTSVELTAEEMANLWFIPQMPGGKVVSEEVQASLEAKGIATNVREDGKRWLTLFGDAVRRGAVKVTVKG
ncbi:hypothetical protein G8A07_16930 [Roseateles sp. DAIF2]|uniref:hypothetical protein n=1 Tax=Roseateles sp. DAIF2 TaxID=2714952 RepID=UPI0018A31B5F|nr:hypothetical protein [Roseateles sp. DAIF2]QPF74437.1 hypothetical protein G8A07_16930 [Roseateles sp. DAIF2]